MKDKFSVNDIKNDEKFQEFLEIKAGLAISTINAYLYILKDFSNFTRRSPTEIHDLHKSDLDNRVPNYDMWILKQLNKYVAYQIKKNAQAGGIKDKVTKIKGFLSAFDLHPLPKIKVNKKQIREDAKYALTTEDIRLAIKNSSPTYQVIFITQAQTGLSISDTLQLDVKDFVSAVSKKDEKLTVKEAIYRAKTDNDLIGCFDLRRKKTSNEFYTFAGPETLRNMAMLLESRDKTYLTPESPIFMKELSYLPKSKKDRLVKDVRLTTGAVRNYVDRLNTTRGVFFQIEVDGKVRNYFRTHKIRKLFANQLRFKAGFDSDDTKYLMGQKTGDVLEHYIDPNNYQALKNNYRKALPYLAINQPIEMEENKEVIEQLQDQLKIQEERHQAEIAQLREQFEATRADTTKLVHDLFKKAQPINEEEILENIPSDEETVERLGRALQKASKPKNKRVDQKKGDQPFYLDK